MEMTVMVNADVGNLNSLEKEAVLESASQSSDAANPISA